MGQDYINKSNFLNHSAQHEGMTYSCELCHKVFHSHKAFDMHAKGHELGIFECNQCSQQFDYETSLSNHVKMHTNVYTYPQEDCAKHFHSYAMHLEHVQYYHLPTKTIPCNYCDKYFQMPTQMHCHRNRSHGPAPT